jgi:glycosyltransferase involved in cell wall biosynthesis
VTVRSISVVVPALNEERNLAGTVAEIHEEISKHFGDYEILLVDDGSTDRTGAIADALAKADPRVRAFHNGMNEGLGFSYFRGVAEAKKEYLVMVPGDRENSLQGMAPMWPLLGTADIIAPYTANPEVRPWSRRTFSRFSTGLMNLMFGTKLRYYNGTVVHRLATLRTIDVKSTGFLYQAESLVRLINRGATVAEVGIVIRGRPSGKSKVFKFRNLRSVAATVVTLVWRVRILGKP